MAEPLSPPVLISGENTVAKHEDIAWLSPTFKWRLNDLPETYIAGVCRQHEQTGRSLRVAEKYNGPNIPRGPTTAL